jgi:Na+/proline symporter
MVILSMTVVPFFTRARVYTAYEYLEQRFDAKTRALTSLLFLLQRGMSCGVIIAAPAVILSLVLGWNLTLTILAIGIPTIFYTMKGGVQAVTWADVKQMVVIVVGVLAAVGVLVWSLPDTVSVTSALYTAGSVGRMQAVDFRFDLNETYTFWSGIIGGLFLALSYFGCDQSQVQRYLTARSVNEGRRSLLMSAYWKIPLQALILLTGVLVFVFFLFQPAPMLFNPLHDEEIRNGPRVREYEDLEQQYLVANDSRRAAAATLASIRSAEGDSARTGAAREQFVQADAAVRAVRTRAVSLVREATGDQAYRDVNYVFPTFVIEYMPVGLVGLLIAAIFAAAMSSIAAELNSLSTATVIDFYRRFARPHGTDQHYLGVSRAATGLWGLFASAVAVWAVELGSLIEVVNRFGSFFYGSILGVFILAVGVPRATGTGAFVGLLAGMGAVAWAASFTNVAFLWHNVIGAAVVVVVGLLVSLIQPRRP